MLTLLIWSGVLSFASASTHVYNLSRTSLSVNLVDTELTPFHLYPRGDVPKEKLVELNSCIKTMHPKLSKCGKVARKASAVCPIDYLMTAFSTFKDIFIQRRSVNQRKRKRQSIEVITWVFSRACNCVRLYVNCALDIMCYECKSDLVTANFDDWVKWKHPYYFKIFKQACNIKMTKIVRKPLCPAAGKSDPTLNSSSGVVLVAVVVVLVIMMLLLIALFGGFVIFTKRGKGRGDKKKDASLKRKRTSSVGGGASSSPQISSSKGGTSMQTVGSPSSMPTKLGASTKFSRLSATQTSPTSPLSRKTLAKGLTGSPTHRWSVKPPSPKAIKTTIKNLPVTNRTVSKGSTL